MLKIPYEEILSKIEEKTGTPRKEIEAKVDEKLKQLFGLVSKEGAAHIIANEMGVKIFEVTSGKLKVKNLLQGMKNVELQGVVRRVYEAREFKTEKREGKVGSFLFADETGVVRMVLWNEQANLLSNLKEGSSIIAKGGYVKERNGFKEIHLGERSTIEITKEGTGIPIPETKIDFPRKTILELKDTDNNVELLGTIVQVFDLKFFEICPNCGKRARPSETGFFCEQHGSVTPSHTAVMNMFLDDGTESIRVVCFRRQLARLLGMQESQIIQFKEEPMKFETAKNEMLGSMLKVAGRVVKNPMFERLELIASLVFINPNPEPEIEKLKEDLKVKKQKVPDSSGLDGQEEPVETDEEIINDGDVIDE